MVHTMVQTMGLGRTKLAIAVVSLICYGELIMGIVQANYAFKYNNVSLKDICTVAHDIVGGMALIDIVTGMCSSLFVSCLIFSCSRMTIQNNNNVCICFNFIIISHCIKITSLLLCLMTRHNVVLCYNIIIDNTPEYWTFITIQFISGLMIAGSLYIACIVGFCSKIYNSWTKSHRVVPINDPIDMMIEMEPMNHTIDQLTQDK